LHPELLRKSLKLAMAGFLTAAVAAHFNRIEFAWYPLLAVVVVVDDNDENTVKAARARILGTLVGGLVTFLVHTALDGWMGVMVSILLMVPVLRALGWEAGLSTAALVSVMFLMLPAHERMNWNYVFNRAIDTSVGCGIAVGVGLLFWPRNRLRELDCAEAIQLQRLGTQVAAYQHWIQHRGAKPGPLPPAALSSTLAQMEQWVQMEQGGSNRRELLRQRWRQRVLVWRSLVHHWVQWERLLVDGAAADALGASLQQLEQLIQGRRPTSVAKGSDLWLQAAGAAERPLPLLAIASELHPVLAALGTIQLMRQKPA
jgi:uncharacterized membrane protein YccC